MKPICKNIVLINYDKTIEMLHFNCLKSSEKLREIRMSKTAFKDFINTGLKKKKKSAQRKEKYLAKVDELYKQIRSYLNEFSDTVQLFEDTIKVNEEYIGEYDAPTLKIDIFGKQASLNPVGTYILGALGRVDLESDFETRRIILVDRDTKRLQILSAKSKKRTENATKKPVKHKRHYVWKLVTEPPDVYYIELDEENFLDALLEVLGG
ncbi:MAG: hypothetical protein LBQ50_07940 [Planctomycetaceae bacterium]|nr:hypothetical protein [Planctomycetaceae bacterium]